MGTTSGNFEHRGYTDMARNKKRAGRPSNAKAQRYACGKIRPESRSMRGETEMAIRSTVISARMRQHQVPAADAGCAEAGYELGRLWLAGKITSRQLEAGKEYHRLVADYQQSIGLPSPYPQGVDLGAARGLSLKGEPDESRIRRTVNQYMHSLTAMADAGKAASVAVREVCVYDRDVRDLDNLGRGLDILADFFGIPVDVARRTG